MHDGFTNRYSFTHRKQPIILVPLNPEQVREDQLKLKNSSEQKKKNQEMKVEIEKKKIFKKKEREKKH